jgi:L-ascorbate metabolism protein UlaG (beta-lactamase superfamily)
VWKPPYAVDVTGQAQIVHLGHSGWAIRTAKHFLIFDWFEQGDVDHPAEASLANGNIIAEELKGEQVVVFATHEHGDHYSPRIFDWAQTIPDIRYVLGLDPGVVPQKYLELPPRTVKKVGDLKVTTIESNDAGVGFLVEVDGLVIMHAGDHANRTTEPGEEYDAYTREIDFIAGKGVDIDLAFYPISGCGFGNPEAVAMGVGYAMKKLRPKVLIPMHAGDSYYLYPEFARRFPDPTGHTRITAVANRGDRFRYGGGEVSQ